MHAEAITLGEHQPAVRRRDVHFEKQWRSIRGKRIGFILQDALVSLDPLRTVGREIDDALRLHTDLGPRARRARVLELLADAGIPNPALTAGQRSGELSGGLRQRALIASAIALSPPLLIADEPTTALDVTIQAQILELLDTLRARGTAVLLISHDLAVVERVADRVAVMRAGEIVEIRADGRGAGEPAARVHAAAAAGDPVAAPARNTAGRGIAAVHEPALWLPPRMPGRHHPRRVPRSLDVIEVSKRFRTPDGDDFQAVQAVSLTLPAGSTLGLVGESGSGKTTTARIALGLTRAGCRRGAAARRTLEWAAGGAAARPPSLIGAIYQDPLSSFDPRWSVGQILADAITGRAQHPCAARNGTASPTCWNRWASPPT